MHVQLQSNDAWTNATGSPFKAKPNQLTVIASMESAGNYRCLDNPAFMSHFDMEMTYRLSSDVALMYWSTGCGSSPMVSRTQTPGCMKLNASPV